MSDADNIPEHESDDDEDDGNEFLSSNEEEPLEDVPSSDEEDNCDDEDRLQYEKELLSERRYIVGEKQLRDLISRSKCRQCGDGVAQDSIVTTEKRILAGVKFDYLCEFGHPDKWYSTPWYGSKSLIGLLLHVSVLLSGATWEAWSLACQFCNISIGQPRSFFVHQKMFRKAVNAYYIAHMQGIHQNLGQAPRPVAVDVRYDSPGFSANKATSVVTDYASGKIIFMEVIDSRSVNRHSPQMERMGVVKCLKSLEESVVDVNEVVSDASSTIRKLMEDEFPNVTHSMDVWHKSKKIREGLVEASKPASCRDLRPWIPAIINHFWWSCGHCNNHIDRLAEAWMSILFHVNDVHKWAFGKCAHSAITGTEGKPTLQKNSPPYNALKGVVLSPVIMQSLKYYLYARHTSYVENFFSHSLLRYCPKRLSFTYDSYVLRNQLAVLDYNHHHKRPLSTNADGDVLVTCSFSRRSKQWVATPRLSDKEYVYIPELIATCLDTAFCTTNRGVEGSAAAAALDAIAPNLSGEANPGARNIFAQKISRLQSGDQ